MAVAVRFEGVSKSFRIASHKNFKELLLGVSGHRTRPVVLDAVRNLNLDFAYGDDAGVDEILRLLRGTRVERMTDSLATYTKF